MITRAVKTTFFSVFLKFAGKPQKRADHLTELFNLFELKIQNFFLLLWYLPGFVWAFIKVSQTKLFRLFFGRTKFSVTYNGQGSAFVL